MTKLTKLSSDKKSDALFKKVSTFIHQARKAVVRSVNREQINDAVVKYTLDKNNEQIFASKYQFYLPSEKELVEEVEKEVRELWYLAQPEEEGE